MCNRITTAFFTRRIATNLQLITYSRIIVANPLEVSITYLQLPTIVATVVTKLMFSCSVNQAHLNRRTDWDPNSKVHRVVPVL